MTELIKQRIELQQVHMHSHTLVDDENGRDKNKRPSAHQCNHGGPASEMIILPQVESPSTPQNKLDAAPLDSKILQSEWLKTKPRRR